MACASRAILGWEFLEFAFSLILNSRNSQLSMARDARAILCWEFLHAQSSWKRSPKDGNVEKASRMGIHVQHQD